VSIVVKPPLVADGTYFSVFIIYVIATFLYGSMNKRAPRRDGVSDLYLTSSNRRAYITACNAVATMPHFVSYRRACTFCDINISAVVPPLSPLIEAIGK